MAHRDAASMFVRRGFDHRHVFAAPAAASAHPFAGLLRCEGRRSDAAWLSAQAAAPRRRTLLVQGASLLACVDPDRHRPPALCTAAQWPPAGAALPPGVAEAVGDGPYLLGVLGDAAGAAPVFVAEWPAAADAAVAAFALDTDARAAAAEDVGWAQRAAGGRS